MSIRFVLTFILVFSSFTSFSAPPVEYKLNNGMKIIVKEDHRAPVVISSIWYRVGSSYESDGSTGVSHALEHMMFRGSKNYPKDRFKTIISQLGGDQNAMTSYDQTMYYQLLPAEKLPIAFQLEADRMQNLDIKPDDFSKEIQVVMEERRSSVEDDPQSLTWERFMAALHVNNPYHHPTIGWQSDLQDMTAKNVRAWYQKWYKPNNALLVVVGDVKPAQVYTLANQYFGAIPSRPLPHIKPRQEIPALGDKTLDVNVKATLPLLLIGYQTPSLVTAQPAWKSYALDVLAAILGGSNSSRFSQDLVRKQTIALQASAQYDLYALYDNQLTIMAIPTPAHTVQDLQNALLAEVQKLQTQLVSEAELARVKTQVIANHVYAKDSLSQQAMNIGMPETVGLSWKIEDEYPQHIEAVTAQQVQDVAKEFLIAKRMTIAKLHPLTI